MNPRKPTKYDALYDRLVTPLRTKSGTKYERLAALVLQSLHGKHAVLHDFKLAGDSEVKHQIDVLLEENGRPRRILIECKDFDQSGKPVGLGIVRDFRSVVEDTGADEAFILTCTGYTREAKKYAKAKSIKLAVMRIFEDADWEGRIKRIVVELHVQSPPHFHGISFDFDADEKAQFVAEFSRQGMGETSFRSDAPVFFVSPSERVQFMEYLRREAEIEAARTGLTAISLQLDPKIWKVQVGAGSEIPFTRFEAKSEVPAPDVITTEVASDRIAELILEGFRDDEVVVFADQVQANKIGPGGRVVQAT